ncbi:MAG: bifunctional aspartate kinase/homoserine dehydrogenase I, partial [Bacteroidales bacterium]
MKVLKFGRSSVVSADTLRLVKEIIQSEAPYCIVVVSADEQTSALLQVMANRAVLRDETYRTLLLEVEEKYAGLTESLVEPSLRAAALTELKENLSELSDTLHGVFLLQELTPKVTDLILSFGARLSALLVSRMVTGSAFFDAREFIKTNASFGHARVDLELTERLIRSCFRDLQQTAVVQGFTGSSYRDETTMLGRRGGDYSAALIAAALKTEALELWMNVDGFMTADPEVATRA